MASKYQKSDSLFAIVACPACMSRFRAQRSLLGRTAKCKRCGEAFSLVDSTAEPRPVPAQAQKDAHENSTSVSRKTGKAPTDKRAEAVGQSSAPRTSVNVAASHTVCDVEPSLQRRAHFLTPIGALVIIPFFAFGFIMWGPALDGMTLPYLLGVAGSVLVGLVFLYALSPTSVDWPIAIRVGAFTATVGIILLLALYWVAGWVHSHPEWLGSGAHPKLKILQLVLFLIGYASAATDSAGSLIGRLLAFTVGVGMVEEVCKILPILWICRPDAKALPTLRECMFLGAFSGLGFGISEALHYSHSMYLPLGAPLALYLLRFTGLPAIHALWTATIAGFLRSNLQWLNGSKGAGTYVGKVTLLCAVPAFLHGVYDVFTGGVLGLLTVAASVGLAFFVFRALIADEAPPSLLEQRAIFERHVRDSGIKKALGTLTLVTLIGGLVFYSGRVAPAQPAPEPRREARPPSWTVTVPQRQATQCMPCSGTGQIAVQCPSCGGSGTHYGLGVVVRCSECRGFGVVRTTCPYCGGTGWR